jgi:hypothetical protein
MACAARHPARARFELPLECRPFSEFALQLLNLFFGPMNKGVEALQSFVLPKATVIHMVQSPRHL